MNNHFHLVIETPRANLVEGMRWFLAVYTNRFNHRHREFGHVFSGRYKALLVEGSGNGYLKAVCDYVHLNPVRAGLLGPEQPLQDHKKQMLTIAWLGKDGGWLAELADYAFIVPSYSIHRVQEVHATLVHIAWDLIHLALGEEDVI